MHGFMYGCDVRSPGGPCTRDSPRIFRLRCPRIHAAFVSLDKRQSILRQAGCDLAGCCSRTLRLASLLHQFEACASAQSTTPDSHSADTQSTSRAKADRLPAVGGVNTGGAHAAVLDKEHRPITAGGFVKDGPVLFRGHRTAGRLDGLEAHDGHAGEEIHYRGQWLRRGPAGLRQRWLAGYLSRQRIDL